jgi:hypothetical protein
MQIQSGRDGLLIGKWVTSAKHTLVGKSEDWRRAWLGLHQVELEEVRAANPEWASKLEALAISPDLPPTQHSAA